MGGSSLSCSDFQGKSRRSLEFTQKIELAVADGNVLVLGEFPPDEAIADLVVEYKASSKSFLLKFLDYLGVEPEKNTVDLIKEVVEAAATGQIIWVKNAQRLPMSLRFWLADVDFRLILQCDRHPKKDIFLDCIILEVPELTQSEILELFHQEAIALGVIISPKRLQRLAANCSGTRSQIRSLIRREKLGLEPDYKLQGGNYLDISPLLLAGLAGFGVLRFMGLATGNRNLYIFGGVCMMLGLAFKYLSRFGGNGR